MNNEDKKTLVLDQDVVEALLKLLRKMNRAGRVIAKQILAEGVNEENFATIAQAAMVDWVYAEVKKANKDFEVDELEAILALDFQEEETN
jgi:hypothetical protein